MASTGLPGDIGSTGEIGGGSSLRIAPISDAWLDPKNVCKAEAPQQTS